MYNFGSRLETAVWYFFRHLYIFKRCFSIIINHFPYILEGINKYEKILLKKVTVMQCGRGLEIEMLLCRLSTKKELCGNFLSLIIAFFYDGRFIFTMDIGLRKSSLREDFYRKHIPFTQKITKFRKKQRKTLKD